MSKIDILLPKAMLPVVENGLEEVFTVHRSYEAQDRAAFEAGIADKIRGAAIQGSRVDEDFLARFPNLEIVANFGVGYDNVIVPDCLAHNVVATNTPDVLTDEVADTALGLLLMTVRELSAAEKWLRDGNWKSRGNYPLSGATLKGRTLGIFGLGRIGKAIAKRAEAFGLDVHYYGRNRQDGVSYPYHDSLTGLAEACDTLMIVAPGGAQTHHAVNAEVLAALGPDGIVLNIGRGTVVNEADLIDALERKVIYGAGLDVFEDEPNVPEQLLQFDRVTLLPHVGSASVATRDAMGQLVVDNIKSWFETGKALTPVPEMK